MRHFTQAHGASKACTALQGVQHPQYFVACTQIVRARYPLAQRSAQLWHQLGGFFLKDREKIFVELVHCIQIVVQRAYHTQRRGHRCRRGRHCYRCRRLGLRRLGRHCLFGQHIQLFRAGGQFRFQNGIYVLFDNSFGVCGVRLHGRCRKLRFNDGLQGSQRDFVSFLQEAGGKLVQQAADVLRGVIEYLRQFGRALAVQLHVLQCMFQCTGHFGQSHKANGCRAAQQRVRQGDNRV